MPKRNIVHRQLDAAVKTLEQTKRRLKDDLIDLAIAERELAAWQKLLKQAKPGGVRNTLRDIIRDQKDTVLNFRDDVAESRADVKDEEATVAEWRKEIANRKSN